MYIEKRIKLNTNIYYVRVEVEYRKNENGFVSLDLKKYKDSYYDGGDFSLLIEEVEKNYTNETANKYDNVIGYMADCLYIYDRIPFLCGIRDVYISDNDNLPNSIGYISKEEIDKYIKENNIKMHDNKNFKLWNGETWKMQF